MRNTSGRLIRTLATSLACSILILAFTSLRAAPAPIKNADQEIAAAAASIGKIAFASDRDGNFEIYVMDADGGGQIRLTENPGRRLQPGVVTGRQQVGVCQHP